MARIKVAAHVAGQEKSGITLALSDGKAGQFMRIGLSEAAQAAHFGGPLDPGCAAIDIWVDDDPGKTHILKLVLASRDDPDALPVASGIKGSISLRCRPWRQVAAGKRPSVALPVLAQEAGKSVSVRLPEWARPEVRKIGQGRSIMGL